MRDTDRRTLIEQLIRQTDAGDAVSREVAVLVGAAVLAASLDDLLAEATRAATTTADRQFVAIAAAHVSGDHDRVDALARDHLLDHTARPLLTWIVNHSRTIESTQGAQP